MRVRVLVCEPMWRVDMACARSVPHCICPYFWLFVMNACKLTCTIRLYAELIAPLFEMPEVLHRMRATGHTGPLVRVLTAN